MILVDDVSDISCEKLLAMNVGVRQCFVDSDVL